MLDGKVNTLLTLISAGSYTKAARMLSLTQPAVSHQMRLLEEEQPSAISPEAAGTRPDG